MAKKKFRIEDKELFEIIYHSLCGYAYCKGLAELFERHQNNLDGLPKVLKESMEVIKNDFKKIMNITNIPDEKIDKMISEIDAQIEQLKKN